MKVLVDIKENKADFIMELLGSFSYVKVKKLNAKDEKFYSELKEAIKEVNLIESGKKKGRSAREFLNEL
jgi:hypothetical protein